MTPLAPVFRSDGFDFKLLKREGDVALFQKTHSKHTLTHYEVVIVQKVKERTFPNGITTPEHEAMPCAGEWGTYGWSPFDLKAAEKRFNLTLELVRNRQISS